jgi:Zn-dependent protease
MRELTLLEAFGIPVRIRPSWFVSAIGLAAALAIGYFPRVFPELPALAHTAMAALATLALFATVYLHELAHALEARRQGIGVRAIALFALGGVAEIETEPRTWRDELRLAGAGPVVSLGIALVCMGALKLDGGGRLEPPLAAVLEYLGLVNIGIAAFNVLPAFPLDGGRLLRAAIWSVTGDFERATWIAASIGRGFGVLLGAAGALLGGLVDPLGGLWILVVAAFIYHAAGATARQLAAARVVEVAPAAEGGPALAS